MAINSDHDVSYSTVLRKRKSNRLPIRQSAMTSLTQTQQPQRFTRPTTNSTDTDSTDEDEIENKQDIYITLQNLLIKITEDKHTTLSAKAQSYINEMRSTIKTLCNNSKATETQINKLEKKMKEQKTEMETLKELNEKAEKQAEKKLKIHSAVERVLQAHTEKLDKMTEAMEKVTREAQEAIKKACQEVEVNKQNQQSATIVAQPRQSTDTGPLHRKTIIVKNAGTKSLTGEEILKSIDQQHLTVPAGTLDRIVRKRNHVEIRCKTEEARKGLQRTLETHQTLNRHFNFAKKSAALHKMLLIGVPEGYEEQYIINTLLETYKLNKDEVHILGKRNHETTRTNNWIILLPTPLAKYIIEEGGVLIGFKLCKLRPHTSISRCRNCQSLTHTTQRCTEKTTFCERCGGNHKPEACKEPLNCINCRHSNKYNRTKYPTDHKASDSQCHTYNYWYTTERNRLDNIFGLNTNNNYEETPTNFHEQERQCQEPQSFYREPAWMQQQIRPHYGMARHSRY